MDEHGHEDELEGMKLEMRVLEEMLRAGKEKMRTKLEMVILEDMLKARKSVLKCAHSEYGR